jgi:hypothetical protein
MMFNLFSEKVSSGNVIEDIYSQTKGNEPLVQYKNKSIAFNSVAVFRPEGSKLPVVYAAGSDKTIREITVVDNKNKTTE